MDRVGFGIKLEQMCRLYDKGEFSEAAKVADTMEWRKVKRWSELSVALDVYESAKLDGASPWTVFSKITLPMIGPVLKTIVMLSIVGTLGINELVVLLTNGAPSGSTFTVKSYIFSNYAPGMADVGVNGGYGCAMSLVTGILLAVITLTYKRITKSMGEQ